MQKNLTVISCERKRGEKLAFVDYKRSLAFLSVFIGHLFGSYIDEIPQKKWFLSLFKNVLMALTNGGAVGVVLFFIISGFCIELAREKESTRCFVVRRLFRIYPMFILALIIFYMTKLPQIPDVKKVLTTLSLCGDFTTPYSLGGVEWTLRIELLFYIVMGIRFSIPYLKKNLQVSLKLLFPFFPPFPLHGFKYYLTIFAPMLLIGLVMTKF